MHKRSHKLGVNAYLLQERFQIYIVQLFDNSPVVYWVIWFIVLQNHISDSSKWFSACPALKTIGKKVTFHWLLSLFSKIQNQSRIKNPKSTEIVFMADDWRHIEDFSNSKSGRLEAQDIIFLIIKERQIMIANCRTLSKLYVNCAKNNEIHLRNRTLDFHAVNQESQHF